jgi:hypothetical protein
MLYLIKMGNLFNSEKRVNLEPLDEFLVVYKNPVETEIELMYWPHIHTYCLNFITMIPNGNLPGSKIWLEFDIKKKRYDVFCQFPNYLRGVISCFEKPNFFDYIKSITGNLLCIVFKFVDTYYYYNVYDASLEKINASDDIIKRMNIHDIVKNLDRTPFTCSYNVDIVKITKNNSNSYLENFKDVQYLLKFQR